MKVLLCGVGEHDVKCDGIHEHIARFATLSGSDNSGSLQLVHDFAGTRITDVVFALQERSGTGAGLNDGASGILKQRVTVAHGPKIAGAAFACGYIVGQFVGAGVTYLLADAVANGFNF